MQKHHLDTQLSANHDSHHSSHSALNPFVTEPIVASEAAVHSDHVTHIGNGADVNHDDSVDHRGQTSHDNHLNHRAHAGHNAHAGHGAHTDHSGHETMFQRRFWVSLILSIPVLLYSHMLQMWLGFTMPLFPGSHWIEPLFSLIIFFYGGLPFLQMAIPELKNRQPGMMTLISMAILVAFTYSIATLFTPIGDSFFWELVALIDIMLLGHWIEMRSVRQASGALDELARLMPDTAERVNADGSIQTVPVSQLGDGDTILVRPGASIAADGEVIDGQSAVNEAMITGESKPVKKRPGAKIIAGTVNGDGSLRIHVTATGDQTALAGIMRLVAEAQSSKSRTQLLADKAAAWLFYLALGVAIITAIAWSVAVGFDIEVLKRVVTVLVIACPHALGLAIPLVVAITTSVSAQNGILVRDRSAMENARNINTIIFDKTGTLTKGEVGVVSIYAAPGHDENELLALTAAVEGDSEHLIARGIRRAAQDLQLSLPAISNFEAMKGRGVQATYKGETIYVGGPRLLEQLKIEPEPEIAEFTHQAGQKGQAVIYMIHNNQIGAAFALADVIRPESRTAIRRLHQLGIQVVMLTGDSRAVAQAVAEELGIDRFLAEVLPEEKDKKVSELQGQHNIVAMVGDGVNDAPALTRANIGIAIGSGTDVAVESAGIILVQSNPLDVVKIIELSRASYGKMIQNLIWATGYNIVALPLAAGVLAPIGFVLSPAVGAIVMSLSTIIVAINAQFLRRVNITTI